MVRLMAIDMIYLCEGRIKDGWCFNVEEHLGGEGLSDMATPHKLRLWLLFQHQESKVAAFLFQGHFLDITTATTSTAVRIIKNKCGTLCERRNIDIIIRSV